MLQPILDLSFTAVQGSTQIIDGSPSQHVMTCAGGAAVDVLNGGDARLRLQSGGVCYTPDGPDFSFAQSDFEISAKVRTPGAPGNMAILSQFNSSDGNDCMELTHKSGSGVRLLLKRGGSTIFDMAQSGAAFAANTDYDILVKRTGNAMTVSRNGVIVLSGTLSGDMPNPTSPFYMGYSFYSYGQSVYGDCWLDNVLMKKDDAAQPPPPPPLAWKKAEWWVSPVAPLGLNAAGAASGFVFVNTTIPSTYANMPPTTYPAPGLFVPQSWIDLDLAAMCGIPADVIAVKIGGIIGITMGSTSEIADLHLHFRHPTLFNNNYIFQTDAVLAGGGDRDMGETVVAAEGGKIKFAWWAANAFDYPTHAAYFFNINLHEFARPAA